MGSIVTTKHKQDHGENEAAVVVCSYTSVNPGKQTSTSTNSQRDTFDEHLGTESPVFTSYPLKFVSIGYLTTSDFIL